MNDLQNIKKLLLPGLKGLPIILGSCLLMALLAHKLLQYVTPKYETVAKLKLDHNDHGLSNANLYQNFDVFTHSYKIKAEEEMLKSRILIQQAIGKLSIGVTYARVGKIKTTELYHDSPFLVTSDSGMASLEGKTYHLFITDSASFKIGSEENARAGKFGEIFQLEGASVVINKVSGFFDEKELAHVIGEYTFKVNKIRSQISEMAEGIDIKAVDKDVPVLRVSFKSEHPQKATDFLNALLDAYILDYVESRSGAARKTLSFVEQQLADAQRNLQRSEVALEKYRLKHNIINIRQETETDLRKIAQLKIQLANLRMNHAALDSLYEYIFLNDNDFLSKAPNFEAFNDLLSTEMVKKLKLFYAERKDLRLKYTENHEEVKAIDEKIADIVAYLKEGIKNSRANIAIKEREIAYAIETAEEAFDGLPTREKDMVVLEREFHSNQKLFNFLTEKKAEASIAQAASISFHRIIQRAETPQKPVSPNKKLLIIVSGFLGLLGGITFVYGRAFIGGKISSRQELEKISDMPIAGIVRKFKNTEAVDDFATLASTLPFAFGLEKHQLLAVSSTVRREGKSETAFQLANAFTAMGKKVLLIDFNLRSPSLHEKFSLPNCPGVCEAIQGEAKLDEIIRELGNLHFISAGNLQGSPLHVLNHEKLTVFLEDLKQNYDLVIADTPATAIALDAITIMKKAEHTLYLVRANYTRGTYLLNADMIAEEYGVKGIKLLLNGVHQASNYNGNYTGSGFEYGLANKSIIQKAKRYLKVYVSE